MIPLAAPFDVMLRNVTPLAPIVVFATLSAVPVVEVRVLTIDVLFCVTLTVPPEVAAGPGPVAVNAAFVPVLNAMPPVKFRVAPLLAFRNMPVPVPPMAPERATVPPVLFMMFT